MSNRVLVFERDNPCNTTIVDQDTDEVFYTVKTEHGAHTVTKVKNADDQVIASWKWRNTRSDVLTLGNAPATSASSWLRKSMMPFKDTVYFSDHQNKDYKWKGNGPGLQFELYSALDKFQPIARFKKSVRFKDRTQTPPVETFELATLTLDPRGQEIQDLVVISFCILEKTRRTTEVSTINRAEAAAIPSFSAGA